MDETWPLMPSEALKIATAPAGERQALLDHAVRKRGGKPPKQWRQTLRAVDVDPTALRVPK